MLQPQKPKGIILSPIVSFPAFSGNAARVQQLYGLLEKLGCDMTFVLYRSGVISDNRIAGEMEKHLGENYIELNDDIYRGSRAQKALNFVKRNFGGKYINAIDDLMIKDSFVPPHFIEKFHQMVSEIKPDFIIVEYAVMSKFIENLPNTINTLVDTHDRFTDRNKRIRAEGGNGLWFNLNAKQEQALLARFNHVLSIQHNESKFFEKLLSTNNEHNTQVATLSILERSKRDTYTESNNNWIGFIGSQNNHNYEGLKLFLEMHWQDIIKEQPNAKLKVAGATFPELQKWSAHGVEFLGRLDDLSQFYDQCSFFINPCITGSGLKIKSVEALTYAKALVTTPEGTEGIEEAQKYGLYSYNLKTNDYKNACIELLANATLRQEKGLLNANFINTEQEKSVGCLQSLLKLSTNNSN